MTEFTITKDCIKICDVGTAEILFCYGAFDGNMVTIKYNKKISGITTKVTGYSPKDYDIYRSYIILNRMYAKHQIEWDYLIFDLFKVELDNKNLNFIQNVDKLLEKHSWIKSTFSEIRPINHFTRVWETGLENIKGLLVIIRLIGEAREILYNSFENPAEIPISACIGKYGTKDCLYKINQEKYPDFKADRSGRHHNVSELLKIKEVSENEITEYFIKSWASKLEKWYKYEPGEDPEDIKLAIKKLAKEAIGRTELSNSDKKIEYNILELYI